jgi:hypothetical protein
MPSPNDPPPPVTSHALDAWLRAAHEQRAALHSQAAAPWSSDARQAAFAGMAVLLQEALEQVRLASAALRDARPAEGGKGIALRDHSAHLLAYSTAALECLGRLLPYIPAAERQAESQLLNLFKDARQKPV